MSDLGKLPHGSGIVVALVCGFDLIFLSQTHAILMHRFIELLLIHLLQVLTQHEVGASHHGMVFWLDANVFVPYIRKLLLSCRGCW